MCQSMCHLSIDNKRKTERPIETVLHPKDHRRPKRRRCNSDLDVSSARKQQRTVKEEIQLNPPQSNKRKSECNVETVVPPECNHRFCSKRLKRSPLREIVQACKDSLEKKIKERMVKDTPLETYQGKKRGTSGQSSANGWYVDGWKETAIFFLCSCLSHILHFVSLWEQ